jgi:glucokinase
VGHSAAKKCRHGEVNGKVKSPTQAKRGLEWATRDREGGTMGDYAIGVDLGGTNLRVAAVDEDGTMLLKRELPTEVSRGRDEVIGELCRAAQQVVQEMRERAGAGNASLPAAGAGAGALRGIGVGVPGLIDSESGLLLESPNLPGWNDYDVKGEIERRLGTTVMLENDANAAALGELWLGAGRGSESLCMYTLGTGVGGGLVLEGRIWRGWNGMAGELGHCNVEPEGHPCGCGSWGCLEQYASATAVVRMAREAAASGGAPMTSQIVYERAMGGDVEAKKVFERVGRALGVAIADMVNILNLSLYVIGGGVSSAWDAFAPAMFAEVRGRSFVYAGTTAENGGGIGGRTRSTQIRRATLGGDGGLYGAARLPMMAAGR